MTLSMSPHHETCSYHPSNYDSSRVVLGVPTGECWECGADLSPLQVAEVTLDQGSTAGATDVTDSEFVYVSIGGTSERQCRCADCGTMHTRPTEAGL